MGKSARRLAEQRILLFAATGVVVAGCTGGVDGTLVREGPAAGTLPLAAARQRQSMVPLLYLAAVDAGNIRPGQEGAPQPFLVGDPEPTASQMAGWQDALSTRLTARDWPQVTLIGQDYANLACFAFLKSVRSLEQNKAAALSGLTASQSAAVAIMGLAQAAQTAIGVVGASFGLVTSLVETGTNRYLYELPFESVWSVVMAQRKLLRARETEPGGAVASITNQGMATGRISDYLTHCSPMAIEVNIAGLLRNARPSGAGTIESSGTPAALTSEVRTISGVSRSATTELLLAYLQDPRLTVNQRRQRNREVREAAVRLGARGTPSAELVASDPGADAERLRGFVLNAIPQARSVP